jgi:thiol-disulfide isomerase/thioredoxin
MMTIRRPLLSSQISLVAPLVLATLISTPILAQDLGIEVGAKAPVVTVQSLDGKQIDLGQYIGKTPVLIEFWATWCPNCRELMPTLLAAEKKFGKRVKFMALAVAINQSPEKVRRWLAVHPLPHDTFYDLDGKAAGAFDAPATSYVVVLDKTGRVVYTGLGGKQNLEAALSKAM